MSEAVEILIKADDQASATMAVVATNAQNAGKKTGNAFQDSGKNVKATSDLFAQLANMSGNSQLAGLANTVSGITEKVGQFSQVSKAGKLGAIGFKLGLMGLAATAGFAVGKVLADIVWQTEKFERAMAKAKETAAELDDQLKKSNATIAASAREDIELIRNPEEKQAAYRTLFDQLNKQISMSSQLVKVNEQTVEDWANAWQVTGNRKQYALDAQEELKVAKENLANLKEQRDAVQKLSGARAVENAAIKEANALKNKSESYIANLRLEVEYLKATREEQIKLDALRNTTDEDRGEAERLLKERDAIKAKQEAEREAAAETKKLQEDAIQAAEKAAEDAEKARQKAQEDREKEAEQIAENARREVERVQDIIKAERERLELQKIEKEQGKEAAAAQQLMNQGVDEATAKQLAAQQAAHDKATQDEADAAAKLKGKQTDEKKLGGGPAPTLAAMESRLLTRGPADRQSNALEDAAASLRKIMASSSSIEGNTATTIETLGFIKDNTSSTTQMVTVP
jgi:hypothetical protein